MTTQTPDHAQWYEYSGLYVLGALNDQERRGFEAHLRSCPLCLEEVRSLSAVAAALPHGATEVAPTPALRDRVLAVATGRDGVPSHSSAPPVALRVVGLAGWLSAAALLLVASGLGLYTSSLRGQLVGVEERLRDALTRLERSERDVTVATRAVATAESRLAVLTASDMRQIDLDGQPAAPTATGRAFWSRSRGLVFTASNLPPLPAGRTYQVWMVLPQAPLSAGLVRPDPEGRVQQAFTTPPDVAAPVAIAVTIEPEGGLAAPSGARYLVGLSH